MGFWDSFNSSQFAYRNFSDQIRNQRFSLSQIDGVIRQLESWRKEFEGLRVPAGRERNSPAALGRINEMVGRIGTRVNQMLDLRTKLQRMLQENQDRIQRLELAIRKLDESLRRDRDKFLNLRSNGAKYGLNQQIREKEDLLKSMETQLTQLRVKESSLSS